MTRIKFHKKLYWLSFCTFIINACLTFQLSNLTLLLKSAGASSFLIPLVWLIPPITGMIIQPLVGYLSDIHTSRFGKRKPYILVWGLGAGLSFLLLPLYQNLLLIIFFTFLIDISLNGSAESLRALLADQVTVEKERVNAFSIYAFFTGLGGLFGAFLPFISRSFIYKEAASEMPELISATYLFCGSLMLVAIALFLFYREKPIKSVSPAQNGFTDHLQGLFAKIRLDFFKILLIHSLSWFGIFLFWLYFSLYIEQIHYAEFNALAMKTKMNALGMDISFYFSIYQLIGLLFTLLVPVLAKKYPLELVHSFCLVLGGIGIFIISCAQDQASLITALCLIGFFWGSLISIPYIIILKLMPQNRMGTYLGVFNISITFPQIMGGFISPFVYNLVQQRAGAMLTIAAVSIILSGVIWFYMYRDEFMIKKKVIIERE